MGKMSVWKQISTSGMAPRLVREADKILARKLGSIPLPSFHPFPQSASNGKTRLWLVPQTAKRICLEMDSSMRLGKPGRCLSCCIISRHAGCLESIPQCCWQQLRTSTFAERNDAVKDVNAQKS